MAKQKTKKSNSRRFSTDLIARTPTQRQLLDGLANDVPITFAVGPAGTGKTLIAVTHAILQLQAKHIDRIIITRPAVSTDEEHGFLPGTLEQKLAPWVRPMYDVFCEHFAKHAVDAMMKNGTIEVAPLAYMRGRTFKDAVIIADEMQLATANQMKMLLTRIGDRSKIVVTGDMAQADDPARNGLKDFLRRYQVEDPNIQVFRFKDSEVVRHKAVTSVLNIYGDL